MICIMQLQSQMSFFANDPNFACDSIMSECFQSYIEKLSNWLKINKLSLNVDKNYLY